MPYTKELTKNYDDYLLLSKMAQEDDYESFTTIYNSYVPGLTAYGLKFTSDVLLVEDCLHDIFVWLWEKRSEHQIQSLKSYLFKSVRTAVLKKINAKNKLSDSFSEEDDDTLVAFNWLIASHEAGMVDKEEQDERNLKLYRSLGQLTEKQKEIIYLRYHENIKFEEIAKGMNMNVKACYKLMGRAIAALREIYGLKVVLVLLLLKAFFK